MFYNKKESFSQTEEVENTELFNKIKDIINSRKNGYINILSNAAEENTDIDDDSIACGKFEIKYRSCSFGPGVEFFIFGPIKRNNEEVFGQFLWAKIVGSNLIFDGNKYIFESDENLILEFLNSLYNLHQYSDSILQNYF